MAISNLSLDCSNYEYNRLSFNYAGSGVTAEIEADYGSAILIDTFTLQPTGNITDHTDVVNICTSAVEYVITIYDSGNQVLETDSITCSNDCIPPTPPIDFDIDCNTKTSSGFDATITEFSQTSVQALYTQLRIYRSTANPSTLTLPDPTYTLAVTLTSDVTEWTDVNASSNTQYWYAAEYYNSLSGEVSAVTQIEGPCTTSLSTCSEAYPLSEFDFDTSLSDCDNLVITDLFNDDVSFKIPSKYNCYDISSITSIYASLWRVSQNETDATTFQIGTFSSYYEPFTQDISVPLIEGVYYIKLTITYLDSFSKTKTITQTQCVFICGDLLCDVACYIASDIENSTLAEYYDAIEVLASCDKCQSAHKVYDYLLNYDANCNC